MSLSISVLVPSSDRVAPAKYRKWSTASGMSAASVSRTGLPFSQLSATASISRLRFDGVGDPVEDRGRSVSDVSPQASFAAWAASRANSTSSVVDLATSQNGRPFAGLTGPPCTGPDRGDPVPADEVLVARLDLDRAVDMPGRLVDPCPLTQL